MQFVFFGGGKASYQNRKVNTTSTFQYNGQRHLCVYMYLCIILPRLISLHDIIPGPFSDNNKPYLDACASLHFFVKELGSKFEKRNRMKSSMPVCLFGECEFYVFF